MHWDHEPIKFGPRAVPARSGRAKTRAWVILERCWRGPHAATGDRSRSVTSPWPTHGQRLVHGEAPFASRMHWAMNLSGSWHQYGVPPSGGPDRLKPGHQTGGPWRALSGDFGARLYEPQRVATAPSPASHRPPLRDGRFMESPDALSARIGMICISH